MTTSRSRVSGPLRLPAFRLLLTARTLSLFGNAMAPIALVFAVLDLTGSAVDVGIVVASRSVTNVILLLFGGVFADRYPKRVLLVGTSAAAALTQAGVAFLVLGGGAGVPQLAALSAVNGAVAAVAIPTVSSVTPQVCPAGDLLRANALLRIGVNLATITGASVAGVIVAQAGPGWALAVDAACYLVVAALFVPLRLPRRSGAEPAGSSMWSDIATGWAEFTARRWVVVVVAQFAVVNAAFVASVSVLGPVVADRSFGRAVFGLVIAAQTVGYLAAGLVTYLTRPHRPLLIGVGATALSATPALALALPAPAVVIVLAGFVAGFAIEYFSVAWDLSLQANIPTDRLARVYSYDALGSFVAIPIGEALIGPAAATVGTRAALVTSAGLIVAASAVAVSTHSVRTLVATESPR